MSPAATSYPVAQRRRLLIPVIVGVALVAVPTVFSVFPSFSQGPLAIRVLVLACWLALAGFGVVASAVGNQKVLRRLEREGQRSTIEGHFRSLLDPSTTGLPEQYQFTVYVPVDPFLIPIYPRLYDVADPAIFPMGDGATGKAWKDPELVCTVVGDAVSTDKHGLTAEQQRRFSAFRSVASVVIRGQDGERLGVLTAIGRDDDGQFHKQGRGLVAMRSLATNLSHLVPGASDVMLPRLEDGEAVGRHEGDVTEPDAATEQDGAPIPSDGYLGYRESPAERADRLRAHNEQRKRAVEVDHALRNLRRSQSRRRSSPTPA